MRRGVGTTVLLLAIFAGASLADPAMDPRLDQELAHGTTITTGGPAHAVAIVFDAEPTPAVLAVLEHYSVPATLFVPTAYWQRAVDHELLAHQRRAEVTIGVTVERDADLDVVIERAARTGVPLGVFQAKRPLGAARAAARRAGLTDVAAARTIGSLKGAASLRGGEIVRIAPGALAAVLDDLERANCARLERKQPVIVPVSLHFFLRDRGKARAVPEDVQLRTAAYAGSLAERCEDRADRRAPGDYPTPRPRGDFGECAVNPLAKGCS